MTEDPTPTDGPEVIETPVAADATPEQEASPAPVSDDVAGADAPSAKDAEPDKPGRAQQRIQRLTGDRDHAMEFAKLQQDRADRAEQQLTARSTPAEDLAPKMPTLEQFDFDDEKFAVAKQAWDDDRIDRRVKEGLAQGFQQQGQAATATQADAAWNAKLQAFRTDHTDFDEVVYCNQPTLDALKALGLGPEIPYHLGTHPEDAARFAVPMSEGQLRFELGKLSASMGETPPSPAANRKQATTAPDPMSPVGGGQPTLSTEDESMDDFMKRRNAEDRERRKNAGGRVAAS